MQAHKRPGKNRRQAGVLAGLLRLGPGPRAALGLGLGGLLGLAGCHLQARGPALAAAATPAPFTLASTHGQLASAAAVARGPLVLIFYRGHW